MQSDRKSTITAHRKFSLHAHQINTYVMYRLFQAFKHPDLDEKVYAVAYIAHMVYEAAIKTCRILLTNFDSGL